MQVFHGPGPGWAYGYPVSDGQLFTIGNLNIKAPLTPGHTEDSVCYAVADSRSGDTVLMVFTSDTLFTGSTGRTDLEGPAEAYGMASKLYYSIYNKLEPLGDAAIIHPAHEAGSVCGPHIADRPESTLGIEKAFNPSLANKTGQEFVKMKNQTP
jgi:hydroxyacylglutathione hydrolase